jgi:transposase
VPSCWKVIQDVREKFSCRSCETIAETAAPSHPSARGRAGPFLIAHILFCKYGLHLPLTRQSATYARERVEFDVSTHGPVGPPIAEKRLLPEENTIGPEMTGDRCPCSTAARAAIASATTTSSEIKYQSEIK